MESTTAKKYVDEPCEVALAIKAEGKSGTSLLLSVMEKPWFRKCTMYGAEYWGTYVMIFHWQKAEFNKWQSEFYEVIEGQEAEYLVVTNTEVVDYGGGFRDESGDMISILHPRCHVGAYTPGYADLPLSELSLKGGV